MKLRKVLGLVLAVVVLAVSGLAIWISQLDVRDIAALVEKQAQESTGRSLRIAGPISLQWSLIPTVAVEGVSFQNAPWGSAPDMFQVKRAEVQLALLPLLSGDIKIKKVSLEQPQILLEVDAKGRKNWEFEKKKPKSDSQLAIDIAELRVTDGKLDYRVPAPSRSWNVLIETLALQTSGDDADIDAKTKINDVPLEMAGSLPNPMRLGKGEGAAAVDLELASTGAKIAVEGDIPLGQDLTLLQLKTAADLGDVQSLGKLVGIALPKLPPFNMTAQLKGAASGVQIENLKLSTAGAQLAAQGLLAVKAEALNGSKLGFDLQADDPAALAKQFGTELPKLPKTRVSGQVHIAKSILQMNKLDIASGKTAMTAELQMPMGRERPALTFKMNAALIDMQELFGPVEPASKKTVTEKKARVFSDERLPIDALNKADVKGDVRVTRMVLRDGRNVHNLAARFNLQRGKLVADPVSMTVEKQPLRLRASADASRRNAMSVEAHVQSDSVPLGALATLAGIQTNLQAAPTDMTIDFSGNGVSVRQLMASANGDVRVVVGPGRWKGEAFDMSPELARVVDVISGSTGSGDLTELKCAVLRFPIRQGVIPVDNGIAAETNKVKMLASGSLDLRNETVDLGVRPKAGNNALSGGVGSLAKLARVGGTFAQPSVRLDAGNAVGTALDIGIALSRKEGGSALTKRLLTSDAPDQPCQVALGKAPATSAAPATPAAPAAPTAPKQLTPADAVDALRGLFGGKK